ncbi:MAG: FAD-dependent oxidoreductase, partial [Bacteroidota bacterium]
LLEDGTEIQSDLTIIAADANSLISNLRHQDFQWKSCDTLYFEAKKPNSRFKVIQLIVDENALINSVLSLNEVFQRSSDTHVISVTVVKEHTLSKDALIKRVSEELYEYLGITVEKFIKRYAIPKALPDIRNVQNMISPKETRLTSRIFLAGDTLLNGSLNGAMQAGELAALGIIQLLEESQDLAQFTSEYI